jgi:spore germination protein
MNRLLIFTVAVQSIIILILLFTTGIARIPSNPVPKEKEKILSEKASPTQVEQKPEITGWFAAWDQEKADDSLPQVMGKIKIFSPMLYRIQPGGVLARHSIKNRAQIIKYARDKEISIAPVISDESDPVRVSRLLNFESVQKKFVDDLVSEAKEENFAGWSIDIEQLRSSQKESFSNFIKNTASKLHENNLKLFVIVFAKDEKETFNPALAHDYKTIGSVADQVQLMTYNYNNELTKPGGQTPSDWYRRVLSYAVKNIPKEKILIGLSTHGYDWGGTEVTGLTYPEVQGLLDQHKALVKYDKENSASVATYEDSNKLKHTIWFEDARSISEKMQIAEKEFGINKFAFWRISAEDPSLWNAIEDN